jgi:hypothetical protein
MMLYEGYYLDENDLELCAMLMFLFDNTIETPPLVNSFGARAFGAQTFENILASGTTNQLKQVLVRKNKQLTNENYKLEVLTQQSSDRSRRRGVKDKIVGIKNNIESLKKDIASIEEEVDYIDENTEYDY